MGPALDAQGPPSRTVGAQALPDVSVLDSVVKPATPPETRAAPTRAAPTRAAPTRGRYSVQLAAFQTRAEADRFVKRLATRGVTARIEGTRKPFRVRTGRYESDAAARSALAALKKRGITGIVTQGTP